MKHLTQLKPSEMLQMSSLKSLRLLTVMFCLVAVALVGMPARADTPAHLRIAAMGATQYLEVGLNKSVIVDLPAEAGEVIVSQPQVTGAIMRSKTRAILQGNNVGETNVIFLDARGNRIAVLEISVINDSANLTSTLRRLIPGSNIQVDAFGDRIVLSGTARSTDDMARALAIAEQFTGSPENVANVMTVNGSQQVMLRVTVAEVSRETAQQFGINLSGSLSLSNLATSVLNNRGNDAGSAAASGGPGEFGVSFDAGPLSIEATLRALQARNAVRMLAEPTLTAMSGQPAEFLVGGEIPINTTDSNGNTVLNSKPYGVELAFTPTVRSNGLITLHVDTSVSELQSAEGAVTKRSATTTVELHNGSTLVIGGLIQERMRQQLNEVPGISNIPILGALFRSRDFVRAQTELLIMVTPQLVRPVVGDVHLPTDNLIFAGDAEAIFLGHMEQMYGVGNGANSGSYSGSVGFILD